MNDNPQLSTHAPETPPGLLDPETLPTECAVDPISLEHRASGWTPERQRQFIEELADCGIVKEAAARVGMTEQGAFRLRRRPDAAGFNCAWDAAVQLGADRLHSTAFERAIAGTVRQRYFQGEVVGEERIFDNRLLIYLLGRLDKKSNGAVQQTIEDWEGSMGAVEDGVAAPLPDPDEDGDSPVWRDEQGEWLTDFAPPDDFSGDHWGHFGDEDYHRRLTPDELETVAAWQARLDAQSRVMRDNYFAGLRRRSAIPIDEATACPASDRPRLGGTATSSVEIASPV